MDHKFNGHYEPPPPMLVSVHDVVNDKLWAHVDTNLIRQISEIWNNPGFHPDQYSEVFISPSYKIEAFVKEQYDPKQDKFMFVVSL